MGRDPLDLTAATALALALEREGRTDAAGSLIAWVGARSWRETAAHLWLLRDRLAAGRLDAGLGDADSLLRRDIAPDLRSAVLSGLIELAADPAERGPLAHRLASAPPWRPALLEAAAHEDPMVALGLIRDLRGGPAPATAQEVAPLVNLLTAQGRFAEALEAWRLAARTPSERAALVRDGRFLEPPDGTVFSWSAEEGAGAAADRTFLPGSAGRALRIEYDGYSLPALPHQLLVLAAGPYRLGWRERAELGPSRISWRIICAADGRAIAASAPARATGPWREEGLDFMAPANGCPTLWLQLAPQPGERRTECVLRIADVRLQPLARGPPRLD
jgi:hypothetical protein